MKNKKKHKIILIINCITLCTAFTIYAILSSLKLVTTETNLKWYELLLGIIIEIGTYIIVWYLGYIKCLDNTKKEQKNAKQQQN